MHLDRLITVLETVAVAGRSITVAELQTATEMPRPTCYRLMQTLAEHRLLEETGGRYQLGERFTRIALLGQMNSAVQRAAGPTMQDAVAGLGETVFLSSLREKSVEIIHVETPTDPARSFVHPGMGFRPMHACSCSKAIAAFAEEAFQQEILSGPMRAYTQHTKQRPEELHAEFETILRNGWAECVEEVELGVSSVAAPVRIGRIGVILSIGATGPVRRFTASRRSEIGRKLVQLSNSIASALHLQGFAEGA